MIEMSRKKNYGWLDIEYRDEDNVTQYKTRRKTLIRSIRDFENFLEKKYGIKGFSARKKKK